MKVLRDLEPSTRQNLLILFTAGLLFWASLASLLPVLSLYIKDVGATPHQVGIVMGMFAIGLLVFRPWVARLADQRDRRLVLWIGLLAVAIAPLGYSLATSIPLLMALRLFHGLSIAAFTTAYSALVVDLSPPRQRGEIIGYMSLVNPVGMAIGPALGGYLQSWVGYDPLFLISSALGFGGLWCAFQVRPTQQPAVPNQAGPTAPPPKPQAFLPMLFSSRLRVLALVLLLVGLAFGTLSTFVPLYIEEAQVPLNPGLFYTAAAIASFSIRIPTGRASDLLGRGRFITVGLVFYTLSMLLLWQAGSANAFLIAGFLEGCAAGLFIPTMLALAADRSAPAERGRVFGVCMIGFDLGIAIAGPTLGFFAISLGYRGLFGLAAGLTALAIVVFISQSSKDLAHSIRFALGNGRDVYALSDSVEH